MEEKKKKRKSQRSLKLVPRGQDREEKKRGGPQELEQSERRNCGFQLCEVATSVGELPGV